MQYRFRSLAALCGALLIAACASTKSGEDAVRPYPLDTCIIMDSKLGSMGDPITKVYNGQEIKFCCQPCVEEFEQNPEEYLARLPK
jgi:hypothetical protein